MESPIHVMHVVKRFATGGLENGVVNIINGLVEGFQHTVVSLTDSDEIKERVVNPNFKLECLNSAGNGLVVYRTLYGLMRMEKPDVFHTRNIGTIELQTVAAFMRVNLRVHGEHGWDMYDPDGKNPKYRAIRRLVSPFIHKWVALSGETQDWLVDAIKVKPEKIVRICNGVDSDHLISTKHSTNGVRKFVTVTRLSDVKNPQYTVGSFLQACENMVGTSESLPTLTVVGDGPLMGDLQRILAAHPFGQQVVLTGQQADVREYLASADVFLLGSLREGISNTILEAMAMALPTVVTNTGGNTELVDPGRTGELVPLRSQSLFAEVIGHYAAMDSEALASMSKAARCRAEQFFSIGGMLKKYEALYRRDSK